MLLAAQPTKQFVTVDQVAALAVFLPRMRQRRSPAPISRSTAAGRRNEAGETAAPADDRLDGQEEVNLALQGGGSHGAFTWGVLDYLLEDGRLDVEAITGTSAGAMNAAVFAEGYLTDGRAGARKPCSDSGNRSARNRL